MSDEIKSYTKPALSLLVKLGSIAVHADEYLSIDGNSFDRQDLVVLLEDPEVKEWLAAMTKQAFLPVKRG